MRSSSKKLIALLTAAVLFAVTFAFQTVVKIQLESTNGRRVSRQLDRQIAQVRLLEKLSNSRCSAGSDWGYSGRTLWVDNGCRGVFEVRYRAGTGIDDRRNIVTVGNSTNARKRLWVGRNVRVDLVRKLSSKPCVRGSTWGYDGAYLWVKRGCRAEFSVVPRR